MNKILVPIDFSEHAEHALDFAMQFNDVVKGKITLMHVLELPASSVNYGADMTAATAEVVYRRELIDGISSKLHDWANKVTDKGQDVAIRIEYGTPFKSIGKEIKEESPDLVIMGSKGTSGLAEVFLGSNAERVIRHSECPVITIKGKTDLGSIKNMVFPTDTALDQESIMPGVRNLQELLGLNMHVLRVKTPHNFLIEKEAKAQLEEFAERNALIDYTINVTEAEFAEDGIITFADEINAGLIVMGTHGRTGIAHMFGGSRAEDVANHSNVPVVTFKIK